MPDAPRFSSLIFSRPEHSARPLRRAALLGLACVLHLASGAALLLGQLLVLEAVSPPQGASQNVPLFFRPPAPRPAAPGQRLGGHGRRGGASRTREDRRRGPSGRAASQAKPRPLAPPAEIIPGAPGPWPMARGPEGEGQGGPGSNLPGDGCPECDGTGDGTGGPGSSFDDLYQEGDPRLVPPLLIPTTRALPKYPDHARRAHVEGTVILLIVIAPDGSVGEVEVVRSPDQLWGFDLAAIEAVKRWRYQPALLQGRPVAVQASVVVEFTLSR